MTSIRPYLVRALIDWIVDNDCTPYLTLACDMAGVQAPVELAVDGKLVLNVSATATRNLVVNERVVCVDCRFQGRPVHISAPVGAVVAVHARENGMGMAFEAEPPAGEPAPNDASKPNSGPKLKLVK